MRKIAQVVGIGVSLLILARALWVWCRQERTRIRVLQRSRDPRQPEELHQFGAHNGLGGPLGSSLMCPCRRFVFRPIKLSMQLLLWGNFMSVRMFTAPLILFAIGAVYAADPGDAAAGKAYFTQTCRQC